VTAGLEVAQAILAPAAEERLHRDFPLAPLTTFRIGGPAALYLEAQDESDLLVAGKAVTEGRIPWTVIGKGSNVLIADRGFPGLVIRLGRGFRWAAREGSRVRAGGAMPLPALANVALAHSLAGLEFGVAIPATLGGAVRMNAGAHHRSMDEVLETIDLMILPTGERRALAASAAGFRYRRSGLPEGSVVVAASAALQPGKREDIRALMDEARAWRRSTQPLAEPNCGSVFKNPIDDHAARLVEAAGAKGLELGGAVVSTKHANFIVARPGASAADVRGLIGEIQQRVADQFGIRLETEVQFVGNFDDSKN
jgi:UDP-N-acetylmuramate dehydrogenase